MTGYMSIKDFAAAVGISVAKARRLAPTIPDATKDPDNKVGKHSPWLIPDSAVAWFKAGTEPEQPAAEETPKPEEQARPFQQPPAVEPPPPGEAGTPRWMKYLPALAFLSLLLMKGNQNQPPRNQQIPKDWPI